MKAKLKANRNPRQQRLTRKQLDHKLADFKKLAEMGAPADGWIRTVRCSLGMNGRQYAERLGVSPARVSALEQDEIAGNTTLKMMQKAAEAMGCVFIYGLVPKTSLETLVYEQASKLARERLKRVGHSMQLENQEISPDEAQDALNDEIQRILSEAPSTLWNQT